MTGPRHPKTLVVDDERLIADSLTTILNRSGFEARAAYTGEMAIELARDFEPDILVTDVVMPGISGIDAAVEVCEMCPKCKVVLFSGQAIADRLIVRGHSQDLGFELISKPVHPETLLAKLRSIAV